MWKQRAVGINYCFAAGAIMAARHMSNWLQMINSAQFANCKEEQPAYRN
jgi:hypothetical protein